MPALLISSFTLRLAFTTWKQPQAATFLLLELTTKEQV